MTHELTNCPPATHPLREGRKPLGGALRHGDIGLTIILDSRKITRRIAFIGACLVGVHVTFELLYLFAGHDYIFGLRPLFHLDNEGAFPTMYSAVNMLFCSALLATIAACSRRAGTGYSFHWAALSIIFLFLATDEAFELHEKLNDPLREFLNISGVFYFAWVIPYGIAVLVFLAAYMKFLIHLPGKTRALFILAGAIFLSGAMGMEFAGGSHYETYGSGNLVYSSLVVVEEALEMAGIIVFIYALLSYIRAEFRELRIKIL
jgi:hypothetical protein